MPEQMVLSAEPTVVPTTDAVAPSAPLPDDVPHFGNMPEGSNPWTPKITFAEDGSAEPAPKSDPEPVAAEPAAASLPPPAANQPQAPQATGQDFFQAMAAYKLWEEGRAAEKDQASQFKNWEPPAITEEEAEAMLTDPKKIAGTFRARDKWHRDATVNLMKPLVDQIQNLQAQVQSVAYREHQTAWQQVRDEMNPRGIDPDKYYGQIYQSIQGNPALMGNPVALAKAVMFLHDGDGSPFSGTPEPAKRPPTTGSGQQAGNDRGSRNFAQDEATMKAAKAFGLKSLSKDSLKAYNEKKSAGGLR